MYNKVELCGVNTAQLPVLSESEKRQLLLQAHAGDAGARERMVEGNLRLVLSVVQRFAQRGENLDDLFLEALFLFFFLLLSNLLMSASASRSAGRLSFFGFPFSVSERGFSPCLFISMMWCALSNEIVSTFDIVFLSVE